MPDPTATVESPPNAKVAAVAASWATTCEYRAGGDCAATSSMPATMATRAGGTGLESLVIWGMRLGAIALGGMRRGSRSLEASVARPCDENASALLHGDPPGPCSRPCAGSHGLIAASLARVLWGGRGNWPNRPKLRYLRRLPEGGAGFGCGWGSSSLPPTRGDPVGSPAAGSRQPGCSWLDRGRPAHSGVSEERCKRHREDGIL